MGTLCLSYTASGVGGNKANKYPYFDPKPSFHAVVKGIWMLDGPLTYHRSASDYIECPKGFITDFASIPWPVHWLIGEPQGGEPGREYEWAAALHDKLFRDHELSFHASNRIFREAMRISDVTPWRREVMYWAVEKFGQSYYNDGPNRQRRMQPR